MTSSFKVTAILLNFRVLLIASGLEHGDAPQTQQRRSNAKACTRTETRSLGDWFRLHGEAFAHLREQVAIATKFGFDIAPDGRPGLNSRPEHIKQVVEASLKRMKTDVIDLFCQHRVDPDVRVDPLFQAIAPARASSALVTFEPGARTAWHTHPLGQILIVTALQDGVL